MAEIDPLAFQKGFQATQNVFDTAQRNRLQDLAMQRAEQAYQQDQTANRLYAAAVGPDGTIDRTKLVTGYAQEGLGSKIPALQTQFAAQDKSQMEARKAQLENGLKQFEAMGQLFSGVRDQASYDAARQQAASIIGPEAAARIPSVYDPQQIAQGQAQALSVKDRLAQELQQLQIGETMRHNRASEATALAGQDLTRRGQDITLRGQDLSADTTRRGQDLTNARAVEANAAKAAADKAPTEFQSKAALFGARAEEADKILSSVDYSPAALSAKQAASNVPVVGGALGAAANLVTSNNNQRAEQAQRDFINAILRLESGAVIIKEEFDNARKQYFPQPGDSAEVIAQKAANRRTAIEGLKRGAGKAAYSAGGSKPKPSLSDIFGN